MDVDLSKYKKHVCKTVPNVIIYEPIRNENEEKEHRKKIEDALRQYGRYLASIGEIWYVWRYTRLNRLNTSILESERGERYISPQKKHKEKGNWI